MFATAQARLRKLTMLVFFVLILGVISSSLSLHEKEGALKFVMLGDWGGTAESPYYTDAEEKIAVVMGEKAKEVDAQFIVALGDNFYDLGVVNVDDPRFKETFENVFTANSLQKRWHVVCGNHDHYGNASAEVAYTKVSNRWYMPDFYYTVTYTVPSSNTTVQIVFIDTIILAGVTDPILRSLPPNGPSSVSDADKQWSWIEKTLNESTADWLIVCGHYPVWSIAEHGPTEVLVNSLKPLLMKYGVSVYFCGHDHSIQHIKEQDSSVNYFVSGAAHLTDPSTKHENDIPKGSLKFHYAPDDPKSSHGSFNMVSINSQTMDVTFFSAKGKEIYSVTISRTR